jgi:hypothetical protein
MALVQASGSAARSTTNMLSCFCAAALLCAETVLVAWRGLPVSGSLSTETRRNHLLELAGRSVLVPEQCALLGVV